MSLKNYLINGPVTPAFIADQISGHSAKTDIGAHAIFLGQVRSDKKDGKAVKKIVYSAYKEMANKEISTIRENAFAKRDLTCLHIYHSVGEVKSGEISLFIFISSAHRKEAIEAMTEVVEQIKAQVPVWKKEIMVDESTQWIG